MPEKDFRSDDAHRSGFVFQVLTMRLLCCADHRRMFSHFTAQIVKIQQIGGTTEKLKTRERQATQTAYRTKILFDANRLIQKASDEQEVFRVTADHLRKLLGRNVIVFHESAEKSCGSFTDTKDDPSKDYRQIVRWVINNNQKAGKGTGIDSDSSYVFLPICKNEKNYGSAFLSEIIRSILLTKVLWFPLSANVQLPLTES